MIDFDIVYEIPVISSTEEPLAYGEDKQPHQKTALHTIRPTSIQHSMWQYTILQTPEIPIIGLFMSCHHCRKAPYSRYMTMWAGEVITWRSQDIMSSRRMQDCTDSQYLSVELNGDTFTVSGVSSSNGGLTIPLQPGTVNHGLWRPSGHWQGGAGCN